MKIVSFTLLLILTTLTLYGQSELEKVLKKADRFYDEMQYKKAVPLYEEAILLKKKQTTALETRLAYCYRMLNQMDKAEVLYQTIVMEERAKPITFYYYGETLMANGKYDEAKRWFLKFDEAKPGDPRGVTMAEACDKAKNIKSVFPGVALKRMDFSTDADDYAPMFYGDGLIFVSDVTEGENTPTYGWTGRAFSSIYYAEQETAADFSSDALPFSTKFNKRQKNSGPASISGNGQYFFFSRNADETNKQGDKYLMSIFMAEATSSGGWKAPKKLPFCNPNFNYMHPAASFTGDTLYFTSDKPMGYGETDIYVAYYDRKKERWSVPENLGEGVNTPEREAFPYVHYDGTLYFSSRGLPGFGGYDLFLTRRDREGYFQTAVNLGSNINSPKDDMGLILSPNKQEGYLASNRRAGTDDDIFHLVKASISVNIEGEIMDKVSRKPISNARVSLSSFDGTETMLSTQNGLFRFRVSPGKEYTLRVEESSYEVYEYTIPTTELKNQIAVPLMAILQPKGLPPVVNNVISPSSSEEVESEMMESVPDVIVTNEISPYEYLAPSTPARSLFARHISKVIKVQGNVKPASEPMGFVSKTAKNKIEASPTKVANPLPADFGAFGEQVDGAELIVCNMSVIDDKLTSVGNALIQLTDIKTGKATTYRTNTEGLISIDLPKDAEYKVEVRASNYLNKIASFSLKHTADKKVLNKTFTISNEVNTSDPSTLLLNINYKSGQFGITKESEVELEKLVKYLKNNPTMNIELYAHTDSRGSEDYNFQLSEYRAKAAEGFLIARGIEPNRIKAKGFGESQLLNHCKDGVKCTEAEHNVNRRTVVRIVE